MVSHLQSSEQRNGPAMSRKQISLATGSAKQIAISTEAAGTNPSQLGISYSPARQPFRSCSDRRRSSIGGAVKDHFLIKEEGGTPPTWHRFLSVLHLSFQATNLCNLISFYVPTVNLFFQPL